MHIGSELERYRQQVQALSSNQFVAENQGFYLLGKVAENSPKGKLDFYTGVIHIKDVHPSQPSDSSVKREAIGPGTFLTKIGKRDENAWTSWYSVGRANNNDIVIRHPSVSKLHARLYSEGPAGTDSDTEQCLWIADVGSTLGTTLNNKLLTASTRYPLQLEDQICLGNVKMQLLDAALLYAKLALS